MAKIDDEVAALRQDVATLKNDVQQVNFNILRILSAMSELTKGGISAPTSAGDASTPSFTTAVDLGPIEERLEELTNRLVKKDEIDELAKKIELLSSERIKEAEETIKRVTSFLQTGLELVKIESTLSDVKSLLEETIVKGS